LLLLLLLLTLLLQPLSGKSTLESCSLLGCLCLLNSSLLP
jgi:hypothetical protein